MIFAYQISTTGSGFSAQTGVQCQDLFTQLSFDWLQCFAFLPTDAYVCYHVFMVCTVDALRLWRSPWVWSQGFSFQLCVACSSWLGQHHLHLETMPCS